MRTCSESCLFLQSSLCVTQRYLSSSVWRDIGSYWLVVPGRTDAFKLPGEKHGVASFMAAEVLLYFVWHYLESTREQTVFFGCCCGSSLPFFRGNVLFSAVRSVPTSVCILPLCASVGVLTWRNCHSSSSEPSLIPPVWQLEIVYRVRTPHPLEKVLNKK